MNSETFKKDQLVRNTKSGLEAFIKEDCFENSLYVTVERHNGIVCIWPLEEVVVA